MDHNLHFYLHEFEAAIKKKDYKSAEQLVRQMQGVCNMLHTKVLKILGQFPKSSI